jgi:hypothetical protein
MFQKEYQNALKHKAFSRNGPIYNGLVEDFTFQAATNIISVCAPYITDLACIK